MAAATAVQEAVPGAWEVLLADTRFPAGQPYQDRHPDLKEHFRSMLVDWLLEVACVGRCARDTAHRAVSILDRFMEVATEQGRDVLQLCGLVCFQIATKLYESKHPTMAKLVYITRSTYTAQQVRDKEREVLLCLEFRVLGPTAVPILHTLLQAAAADDRQSNLAQCLADMSLQHPGTRRLGPLKTAAAAVLLGRARLGHHPLWPPALAGLTGLAADGDLITAAGLLERAALEACPPNTTLTAVYNKFAACVGDLFVGWPCPLLLPSHHHHPPGSSCSGSPAR